MLKIFVAGQKSFGAAVYKAIKKAGHEVIGVSCPNSDKYYDRLKVAAYSDPSEPVIIDSDRLLSSDIPERTEVLISAHSHHYISEKVRKKVRYAIGYHPSLLPRHRGRDAVRWAIHCKDDITGGTVYRLTDKIDGGEIICQEPVIIKSGWNYKALWREALFPLGIKLILESLELIETGAITLTPQDEALSTWEPPFESRRLHRPELMMIE